MTDTGAIASEVVHGLESAWNAGDGTAYAAYFTEDADLINVFGMHFHGRRAIAELMARVFATMFKGSTSRHEITSVVSLNQDVILVHLAGSLSLVDGERKNRQTLVLVPEAMMWRIRAFQNTGVNESAPLPARQT
jgi:uncharacterized protein (TIGR02246 family)